MKAFLKKDFRSVLFVANLTLKQIIILSILLLSGQIAFAQTPGALNVELQAGPSIFEEPTNFDRQSFSVKTGLLYGLTKHLDLRFQFGFSNYKVKELPDSKSQTYNFTYGFSATLLRSLPVQPFIFLGSSFIGYSYLDDVTSSTRFDSSIGISVPIKRIAFSAEVYHYFQDLGKPHKSRLNHHPVMLSLRYQIK